MQILVTGGAGYIGSHACLELLEAGYDVVVVDDLRNSHRESLRRVEALAGRGLTFHEVSIGDAAGLDRVFLTHDISAVMHFAGLKAVGESCQQPLAYYSNNVSGSLVLFAAMRSHGVGRLIFSSSATVYGAAAQMPIGEDCELACTNPYGRTKLIIEDICRDMAQADRENERAQAPWRIALLRYFNPVGAHPSGQIGEDPRGIPNNLMPYVTQVACGKLEALRVFGDDYPTRDGTGVRDYIHVVDLAKGHVRALAYLEALDPAQPHCEAFNLGTGTGYSVLEVVQAFETVTGRPVPRRIAGRRRGDVAACYADPTRARERLGWTAERTLEDMVEDAWRWQSRNPQGFRV